MYACGNSMMKKAINVAFVFGPKGVGKTTMINAVLPHADITTSSGKSDDGTTHHFTTYNSVLTMDKCRFTGNSKEEGRVATKPKSPLRSQSLFFVYRLFSSLFGASHGDVTAQATVSTTPRKNKNNCAHKEEEKDILPVALVEMPKCSNSALNAYANNSTNAATTCGLIICIVTHDNGNEQHGDACRCNYTAAASANILQSRHSIVATTTATATAINNDTTTPKSDMLFSPTSDTCLRFAHQLAHLAQLPLLLIVTRCDNEPTICNNKKYDSALLWDRLGIHSLPKRIVSVSFKEQENADDDIYSSSANVVHDAICEVAHSDGSYPHMFCY